jgi:hypothetical protein
MHSMQLRIPHAPRPVRFGQIPGARSRLALTALGCAIFAALMIGLALSTGRSQLADRDFTARAVLVTGKVTQVRHPPAMTADVEPAKLTVLYRWNDAAMTASSVDVPASEARGLGAGSLLDLLVDPNDPDRVRAVLAVETAQTLAPLSWAIVVIALLLAIGGVALELRRAWRRELEPLRHGALVWLTPDRPTPEGKQESVFGASFWRDDVKYSVRARGRLGHSPVRNADKLLAAVVPSQPTWVRIIDEDLARTLGWFG